MIQYIYMSKNKLAILAIFIVVFLLIIVLLSNFTYKSRVVVGGKIFSVEVVETSYFLEKGLSGHKPLLSNEGMFFVFEKPDKYGFWMKNMSFPIDIVWFTSDLRVNHIEKSVSPETYPKVFTPETESLYVLEISAGQSDELNLKIGDQASFLRKASKNL